MLVDGDHGPMTGMAAQSPRAETGWQRDGDTTGGMKARSSRDWRPIDSALWTKSQMCVPTSRMQRATLSALAKLNYERQNKQELCSSHITGFSTCRTVAQRLPFHEQIVFFLLVCIVKRQEAHGLRTFPIPPHVIGRPSLGDGGKAYGLNRSGTKWYLGASAQPAAGSTTTQTCTGSTALAPMPAARLPAAGLPAG